MYIYIYIYKLKTMEQLVDHNKHAPQESLVYMLVHI